MTRPVGFPSPIRRYPHEKNLSALSKTSRPPVRIPGPHGNQERPRHHQSPPRRWPQAPRRSRHDPQVRPPHAGVVLALPRSQTPFGNIPLFLAKLHFALNFAQGSNRGAQTIAFPNRVWERGKRPPVPPSHPSPRSHKSHSPRSQTPFGNVPLFLAKFHFALNFAQGSNRVAQTIAFPNRVWERGKRPPVSPSHPSPRSHSPRSQTPFGNVPLFLAKFHFALNFAQGSNRVAQTIAFPNRVWERGKRPPVSPSHPSPRSHKSHSPPGARARAGYLFK